MRAAVAAAALVGVPAACGGFATVGIDMGRMDDDGVRAQISAAKDFGLNVVTFSSDIIMDAFEVIGDTGRAKRVDGLCAAAAASGIPAYIWNHQVEDPPGDVLLEGGKVLDFDSPALWSFLADENAKLKEAVPHCAGVVLSLTEAKWQIHRDDGTVKSTLPPASRVAKLINAVHSALRGWRVVVRDFFRSPEEMSMFLSVMNNASAVPADVTVMSKNIANDFHYSYPPNPNLGRYTGRSNWLETEPGDVADPAYWQSQTRLARDRGMDGVVPRIHNQSSSVSGKPWERIGWYAAMDLARDPDLDVDEWAAAYWAAEAGATAAGVEEIQRATRSNFALKCNVSYALREWIESSGKVKPVAYTDSHLASHYRSQWSGDAADAAAERLLRAGGPAAVDAVVAEKAAASRAAAAIASRLRAAKGGIPKHYGDVVELYDGFASAADNLAVWATGYFGMRGYRNDPSDAAALAYAQQCVGTVRAFVGAKHDVMDGMKDFLKELEGLVPSGPAPPTPRPAPRTPSPPSAPTPRPATPPPGPGGCTLEEQYSKSPCTLQKSFGCYATNNSMYVTGGCRGLFICGGGDVRCPTAAAAEGKGVGSAAHAGSWHVCEC